jgi:hypothetical protein
METRMLAKRKRGTRGIFTDFTRSLAINHT